MSPHSGAPSYKLLPLIGLQFHFVETPTKETIMATQTPTQTPTPARNPTSPANPNPNIPGDQSGKSGKTVPAKPGAPTGN